MNKNKNISKNKNKLNKNKNISKNGTKSNKNKKVSKNGNKLNKNKNISKNGNKLNKPIKKTKSKKNNVHKKYQNILDTFEENPATGRNKFYNEVIRLISGVAEKPYRRKEHERNMSKYKTEEEYQNSFDEVIKFSKKYTKAKKMVDVIVYNQGNSDGFLSAYLVWDYVTDGGSNSNKIIQLIPQPPDHTKSGVSKNILRKREYLQNKKVIVLDIKYNEDTYNFIKDNSKSLIYIDNHINKDIENKNNVIISAKNNNNINKKQKAHATCALVYKFLYPKKEVPYVVQSIDSSDANLFLKYIADPSPIATAFSVLFSLNQSLKTHMSKILELNKFMKEGTDIERFNYLSITGITMEKLRENMKKELVKNTRKGKFTTGNKTYTVQILNFGLQSMTKIVGKNMADTNIDCDFAVVWFVSSAQTGSYIDINLYYSYKHRNRNNPFQQISRDLKQKWGNKLTGSYFKDTAHFRYSGNPEDISKFIRYT